MFFFSDVASTSTQSSARAAAVPDDDFFASDWALPGDGAPLPSPQDQPAACSEDDVRVFISSRVPTVAHSLFFSLGGLSSP
eukprot:m.134249 g.134249  ORF g.134249 m.134249 type:complete len:81 (+) comp14844_c1_seq3:37-279(+)